MYPQVSSLVDAFRGSAVYSRDQTAVGELQMAAAMQGRGGGAAAGGGESGGRMEIGLGRMKKYEASYITQVGVT